MMRFTFALRLFAVLAVSAGVARAGEPADYASMIEADQPVALWRFSEGETDASPQTAGEEALAAASVDVEGPLRFGAAGPQPPTFPRFAPENTGIEFPRGGAAYVRVADPGAESAFDFTNGDSITIEAWVNPEPITHGGYYYILGKGRTHRPGMARDNHNYALRLSREGGAGGLSFLFRSAGKEGDWHRWTSRGALPIGDGWHHVAVTYTFGQPESIRGYVDGEPVGGKWDMGGATEAAPVVDDDELWIGSSMGGNPGSTFRGGLDEVALYREALSADRIAARYTYIRPEPRVDLAELPEHRVRVDLYEGLADTKSWDFRPPKHMGSYEAPAFAFLGVPKKYNERAIHVDRTNPFLIRAHGYVTLPEGPQRLLVRCRNASRVYLDGELIAETAFHNISSSAHGTVFDYEPALAPHLRPLHRGDTEAVAELEGDGQRHLLRFDMIVGGQQHRPDFGETALFLAPPGEDFRLLSTELDVRLTNEDWPLFEQDFERWMTELEAEHRRAAGVGEAEYWARRHRAARQAVEAAGAPEPPAVDAGLPVHNAIDRFIGASLQEAGEQPAPLIDDLAFLRRLTLDCIGVVPTEAQIERYLSDPPQDRRQAAIDRLLEHPGWADHWVGYWQDVLAENPNLINPTLNNTGPFRWWIYESFYDNKPFDRFATELILMEGSERHGGPAGFGVATQNDAPMAAKAHIVGQALLGMEMKCARCHDAPFRDFRQEDLFSLAAMLGRSPQSVPATSSIPGGPEVIERMMIEVTLEPGTQVQPKWPFDDLISEDELDTNLLRDPADPRERLALMITSPQNARFAQVIVNRLWKRYLGQGLVEPVDDWGLTDPSHPELLDYLARELVLSGYDLKHVAGLIFQSHVYQRTARGPEALQGAGPYLFAAPLQRRMTAEQLVDSLLTACGKPHDAGPMNVDIDGARAEQQSLDLGVPRRAWMFTSLSNERDRPSLALPFAQPYVTLLETFGWRGSRQNPVTEREHEPNVLQPAVLSNGVLGRRLVRLSDDSDFTALALEDQPLERLIERVYLRMYTRRPTAAERQMFLELLGEGYDTRRTGEPPAARPDLPRNLVSWSNHLHPRANEIKLELQRAVEAGDPPSPRLAESWRERMEDMLWAMMCSPEFVFVP